MTVVRALAILEAATLECKKRDINTPEVRQAPDFLEPYIQPPSLIAQYRHELDAAGDAVINREGQQQALRASFRGIRTWARELLSKRMNRLVREFATVRDPKVKEEIDQLSREPTKLREPWGLWRAGLTD